MDDTRETKEQLLAELQQLRQQNAELARFIQERDATEQQLNQQILDTVPEGIFLLDHHHCLQQANTTAQRYLRRIVGIGMGERLIRLGELSITKALAEAEQGIAEIYCESPVQRIYEIQARSIYIKTATPGWVVLLRDVTKERDFQKKLKQRNHLAAIGQLAAGIAHDFNNILTSIIGYTQLAIIDPGLSQETKGDLQRVLKQGQRGAHLIRQILDFSRQSVQAEQRPINLSAFTKDITKYLVRIIRPNIQVELTTTLDNKDYIIRGNLMQLQQTITNVVLNAEDAMPHGGKLMISLSSLPNNLSSAQPDNLASQWILLKIADTGCGILPEHLERVFEPFFTTKEVGQGTGLGLAQAYGIIKQHDGDINIESQVGQGTIVSIYLPIVEMA